MQSQVRFNRVPEKVPEKVWEALVQSQVRISRVPKKVPGEVLGGFGAKPGQVQQGSGAGSGEGSGEGPEKVPERFWEASVQSQVRFNRVSGAGSGEGSGEGLGGFGAKPSQDQQGSEEGSWRLWRRARSGSTGFRIRFWRRSGRLWCKARSGSTGFRRRFWKRFQEALVQSQVKFNRVPEKVPEKVSGRPWCRDRSVSEKVWEAVVRFREALVRSQVRFNRVPEQVPEKAPEKVWEAFGSKPGQVEQDLGPFNSRKPS